MWKPRTETGHPSGGSNWWVGGLGWPAEVKLGEPEGIAVLMAGEMSCSRYEGRELEIAPGGSWRKE